MIDYQQPEIQKLLFQGNFGLEKESLRIDRQGHLAQSPDPFAGNKNIVCDFCANQTEINTDVHDTIEGALNELETHTQTIQQTLAENQELLWPFSSPPIIRNEEDIPVAYSEQKNDSWKYRMYLSDRYGRYRMTFCGIHYNFSFGDDLLEAAWKNSTYPDLRSYQDALYLDLAAKASACGWLITVLTSASPVIDGSYYEKSLAGHSYFSGMSSLRNSEMGYWNFFTPVVDCGSLQGYIDSINRYVQEGFLKEARELYYPIRLKPNGAYSLDNLKEQGIGHMELRMLDLNPLEKSGLALEDARFIHLFLIWLACQPPMPFNGSEQLMTEQNFKNAAHYDLKTTKIVNFDEKSETVYDAAMELMNAIRSFYETVAPEYLETIDFQIEKLTRPHKNRYAWSIRRMFEEGFVNKGVELARQWQDIYLDESQADQKPEILKML